MSKFNGISYINNCFKQGRLIRWSDNTMPLTIFIAPFRWYKAKDEEYEYYKFIEEALTIWEQASCGKVKFQQVENLYDSQINIEWKRVERDSLGHCNFNFDKEGRFYSAEVSIGLSDGIIHREYENKNEVCHTLIHEIGHALGIQHSPFKNDIMYVPHQYGITSLSNRDLITLKWLYQFPYGISREELLAHYKLSANYDPDKLIYMLETGASPEEIESRQCSSLNDKEQLSSEQKTLAELNKFNLSLQNFSVSEDKQEYFRKLRIKKDLGEK